jgi:hypothetical protein
MQFPDRFYVLSIRTNSRGTICTCLTTRIARPLIPVSITFSTMDTETRVDPASNSVTTLAFKAREWCSCARAVHTCIISRTQVVVTAWERVVICPNTLTWWLTFLNAHDKFLRNSISPKREYMHEDKISLQSISGYSSMFVMNITNIDFKFGILVMETYTKACRFTISLENTEVLN